MYYRKRLLHIQGRIFQHIQNLAKTRLSMRNPFATLKIHWISATEWKFRPNLHDKWKQYRS